MVYGGKVDRGTQMLLCRGDRGKDCKGLYGERCRTECVKMPEELIAWNIGCDPISVHCLGRRHANNMSLSQRGRGSSTLLIREECCREVF
jgi:hypothetical protein